MKEFFSKLGNKIKNGFLTIKEQTAPLRTLVAMQMKDKLSFSFKANKKEALIKLFFVLLLFFVLIFGLNFAFNILGKLSVFAVGIVPIYFFNFFFILLFLIAVVTCLVGFTNSLYFSPDNQVLLTYPVRATTVFVSKIVVYYIFELIKNFAFLIPLFMAYGLANSFHISYYFWLIFCFFFISMLPVALAAFLSIIVMQVKMFLMKNPILENILFTCVLIGITIFLFYLFSLIPSELKIAQEWQTVYLPALKNGALTLEKIFMPIEYLSKLMMGYVVSTQSPRALFPFSTLTAIIFFIMLGTIIILLVLAMLVVRPLYFKMASKPFEYKKKIVINNFLLDKKSLVYCSFIGTSNLPSENKIDKRKYLNKLEKILDVLKKEEGHLIKGNKVDEKKILSYLNKYGQDYKFVKGEIKDNIPITPCFAAVSINGVIHLILIEKVGPIHFHCYDPFHLSRKNDVKNSIFSTFIKDLLLDLRSNTSIFSNFCVMLIPGLLVYLLNKILCAMKLTLNGVSMTVTFSLMIILLILLASNISAASIYSKEGQSSYLLKAAPVNYTRALTTKLISKFIVGVFSIIFTTVAFFYGTTIHSINFIALAFLLFFLFSGHLLWSAELDYMNPQDNLYNTSGETRGISNSSETLSGVFALVTTAVFCGAAFFLFSQDASTTFVRLTIFAAIYFVARAVLFYTKVKAYNTARGELK